MKTSRIQHSYDHRLEELVRSTGDIQIALDQGVPRSSVRDWLKSPPRAVVTAERLDFHAEALPQEVVRLRAQNRKLSVLLRLLVVLTEVLGLTLSYRRLPDDRKKPVSLDVVERVRTALSMRSLCASSDCRLADTATGAVKKPAASTTCPLARGRRLTS